MSPRQEIADPFSPFDDHERSRIIEIILKSDIAELITRCHTIAIDMYQMRDAFLSCRIHFHEHERGTLYHLCDAKSTRDAFRENRFPRAKRALEG